MDSRLRRKRLSRIWLVVVAAVLGIAVVCAVAQQDQPVTLKYLFKLGDKAVTEIEGMGTGKVTVEVKDAPKPFDMDMSMNMNMGMDTKVIEALQDGSGRVEMKFAKFEMDNTMTDADPKTPDMRQKMSLGPDGLVMTVNGNAVPMDAVPLGGIQTVPLSSSYEGTVEYLFDIGLGQMTGDSHIDLNIRGETVILKVPKDPTKPEEKVDFSKMFSEPFVMRIDALGKAVELEGRALELLQRSAKQSGMDMTEMMRLSQGTLPDHPVKVGDTWQTTTTSKDEKSGLQTELQTLSRLMAIEVKDGHRLARIKATATITMSSPALTEEQKQQEVTRTSFQMEMSMDMRTKLEPGA